MMREITVSGKERIEISEDAAVKVDSDARAVLLIKPEKDMKISISTGKNATVDCLILGEKRVSIDHENHVGENSVVRTTSLWLSDGKERMLNSLEGKGAEAYDLHVFVGKSGRLDIDATLRHAAEDTKGDVTVRGVVYDKAFADLDGMIKVEKGARGSESFIAEHVLLLSKDAHARAEPKLEIENNDVSSSHAASVAPIDPAKIFYLTSRGINEEDAKKLIVEGFMESAIDKVVEEEARKLVSKRVAAAL